MLFLLHCQYEQNVAILQFDINIICMYSENNKKFFVIALIEK